LVAQLSLKCASGALLVAHASARTTLLVVTKRGEPECWRAGFSLMPQGFSFWESREHYFQEMFDSGWTFGGKLAIVW
jgi:hypothetical protein